MWLTMIHYSRTIILCFSCFFTTVISSHETMYTVIIVLHCYCKHSVQIRARAHNFLNEEPTTFQLYSNLHYSFIQRSSGPTSEITLSLINNYVEFHGPTWTQVVERLPWNGVETWLKETWDWLYLSWYMDWGLVLLCVATAIVMTIIRMVLNSVLFTVSCLCCAAVSVMHR